MKKVYDILNAGPQHRFMVRNPEGAPFIVGNCTQSLARDIMAEIIVSISKQYHVLGTVHDEVLLLVPEDHAETALKELLDIMRKPPAWAPDLPLDAEGGIGDSYGDAK